MAAAEDTMFQVIKGQWSIDEDSLLAEVVQTHGAKNWSFICRSIPGRTASSCRLRWCNHLSPELNHGPFTPQEDQIINRAHEILGNKWSDIARLLVGRTDNLVKNRWHCYLKKQPAGAMINGGGGGGGDGQGAVEEVEEVDETAAGRTESDSFVPPGADALVLLSETALRSEGLVDSDSEENQNEPVEEDVSESTDIDPNIVRLVNKTVRELLPGIVRKEMENIIPTILREEMEKCIPIMLRKEMEKLTLTFIKKD
ncbi:transcription factor MYB73-like [Impatiens glandulifera]|uniref:transcription factor MYB73-like n=1 Tax=Impatiens glandulifera TaxID=253017 RepID=UPI001FB08939|nr:transcription factor MYB73-like [Impatiens glandulifera]